MEFMEVVYKEVDVFAVGMLNICIDLHIHSSVKNLHVAGRAWT